MFKRRQNAVHKTKLRNRPQLPRLSNILPRFFLHLPELLRFLLAEVSFLHRHFDQGVLHALTHAFGANREDTTVECVDDEPHYGGLA